MEGIRLNDNIDYSFASLMFQFPEFPDAYPLFSIRPLNSSMEEVFAGPQGPSMKFFYENFGRVLRGEWWFYSNSDSLHEYLAKLSPDRDDSSADWEYFNLLLHCLAYDIFGFVAELIGESDSDQAQLMNRLFKNSLVTAAKNAVGVAMPAERFIELYKRNTYYGRESEEFA